MLRKQIINEDTRPQGLPIWYVPQLEDKIGEIYAYNIKSNREKTIQWFQDIENVKQHISERAISLQYTCRPNTRWKMPQHILGYDVYFSIKNTNDNCYVCVYNMELNLDNFGLVDPSNMYESRKRVKKIRLTESEFHTLISECVKKIPNHFYAVGNIYFQITGQHVYHSHIFCNHNRVNIWSNRIYETFNFA